ncbi:MAG: cytochrome c biogenesis protein CcdA [Anaerolineales bacterium]
MNARTNKRLEPGLFVGGLLALAAVLLGVLGYRLGFLAFVYSLMIPQSFSSLPVFLLAAVMGVAAFFSPCVFPLLPGYMTFQIGLQHGEKNVARSLWLGVAAALGVLAVNLALGVLIGIFGSAAPFSPDPREDPWTILLPRLLGGLFVAYLGAQFLLGRDVLIGPLARLAGKVDIDDPAARRPAAASFLYGALYNLIGIGCTGALMLALLLYTFTLGRFWVSLGAFAVFAGTMAVLMIAATLLVGLAQSMLIRRMNASIASIRRVSGAVMLAVGALTVAFVLEGNESFVRWFFPFLP